MSEKDFWEAMSLLATKLELIDKMIDIKIESIEEKKNNPNGDKVQVVRYIGKEEN